MPRGTKTHGRDMHSPRTQRLHRCEQVSLRCECVPGTACSRAAAQGYAPHRWAPFPLTVCAPGTSDVCVDSVSLHALVHFLGPAMAPQVLGDRPD